MNEFETIQIAEFSFKILSLLGAWRPSTLTTRCRKRIYNFYSIASLIFQFFFSITFFINLCQNINDQEVYIENIFFFTTTFLLALKITYLKFCRQDIKCLINLILLKSSLPRNNEEVAIYKKCKESEMLVEIYIYSFVI